MAKTRGAAGAAMTEAPRTGDPLDEQVVDEQNASGRRAAEQAVEEPATQPIVAEAGGDPLGVVQLATERPGVNDASGATDESIARRAYELYQARGGADGADMDDWLRAEHELRSEPVGRGDEGIPELGPSDERDNPAHRPID